MNPALMPEQPLILGDFANYIVPHEERPDEELWCERTETDTPGWHLVWRRKETE